MTRTKAPRTAVLHIRLTEAAKNALVAYAIEEGKSITEVVEAALLHWIGRGR